MELNNLCGKVWWVTAILLSFIGHVQAACYYSYYYYNYYCYYYYYYSYTYSSVGTIAGAVVGGIIGLACLVAFIVFCCYLAKKGHSRGVRGTVIRPQAQVTVVSSNQYPHQPMQPQPPPAYSAHQNYGPPPAYGPPPPPGPSYPPPPNPAYPPMASGSVPPPAPMYPGGKQ